LNLQLYKKIIDECCEYDLQLTPQFFGEPLLHPQFIEMIKYAKLKGIDQIQFTTNAMLLDEKI